MLWYYPVVGLFKIFGVNFVLMRAYFLALSALTAVLAFFAVFRAGRRPWVAFAVALVCLLVPGMIFKNYIPLLVVANSLLLLQTALTAPGFARSYLHVLGGGILVGLTLLVRIDLGLFFTSLWIGLHLLRLGDPGVRLPRKLGAAIAGIVLTISLAWLVHLPVLHHARRVGFDQPFSAQYLGWARMIDNGLRARVGLPQREYSAKRPRPAQSAAAPVFLNRDILRRNAWRDFVNVGDFQTRALVVLTYLPVIVLVAMLGWTIICLAGGLHSSDPATWRQPLGALVLLGGALTAFPQFFFFRPDPPHLSEFSPGYWVAVTGAALLLEAHEGSWRNLRRWPGRLLLGVLVLHAALYLARMLPDRWTGTIAARQHHTKRFAAENGVDVYVSPGDRPALEALCKVVWAHATPDDYLVAYPYHPMINLMTNRRTYEKDVYIDNATRRRRWDEEAIARFEKFKPAVIVLSDWAVNAHDGSRFSVWAAPTKAWIQTHYAFQGTFKTDVDEFEVYTRPASSR